MKRLLFSSDSLTTIYGQILKLGNTSFKLNCLLLVLVMANGVGNLFGQTNCNCPQGAIQIGSQGSNTLYTSTNLPSQLIGTTLCISGTLTINTSVSMEDCFVFMNSEAEIVVDGQTFGTINSEFRACTDFLWKGIRFINNAFLTIDDSQFFDAKNAINVIGNCPGRIIHSHFERNKVGVNLNSATMIGTFENTFTCPVAIRQDITLPFNPNGERSYAGIAGNNGSNILSSSNYFESLYHGIVAIRSTIAATNNVFRYMLIKTFSPTTFSPGDGGYCVFSSESTFSNFTNNTMAGSYVGIWADKSSLIDIHHNRFDTIDAGIYNFHARSNAMVRDNEFNIGRYGIFERFSLPGVAPNIHNNTISRNAYSNEQESAGIKVEQVRNSGGVISNNIMDLDVFCYGVLLDNCVGHVVTNNQIFYSITYSNIGLVSGEGILVKSLGQNYIISNHINCNNPPDRVSAGVTCAASIGNTICCNTVTNAAKCFQFSGICDRSILQGNGNIGTYNDGFLINRGSIIGPQPNNVNNTHPKSSYNYWNPQSGGRIADARNLNGTGALARRSEVTAKGCILPEWPSIILPNQNCDVNPLNWFMSIPSGGSNQFCGTLPDCQIPIVGVRGDPENYISENDIAIARGELGQVENGNILEWEGMKHLILNLRINSNLLGLNSSVDSFYNAILGTNLMKFYLIDSFLFRASNLSLEEISTNDSLLLQLVSYSVLREELLDSFRIATDSQDIANLILEMNENEINQEIVWNELNQNFVEHIALITTMKDTVQAILNSIASVNALEDNEKMVRQLHIDLILPDLLIASPSQLNQLSALSALCPYKDGNLVFWARDLYNLYNDQAIFNDSTICTTPENLILDNFNESDIEHILNISPNPVKDIFEVSFGRINNEELHFKIISLDGKEMFDSGVQVSDPIRVHCHEWTAGIYNLVLYSSHKFLGRLSIVILK
ncbi:MAG: hypothetical protein JNK69_01500 [Saprospiraceae bacterium]|nr:hypothetical protein [Candidatus Vicinibacter proximus]MBL7822057.1 hypothetical protein [Saprospiraceae bacterium]MCC6842658.1 hypothetical protein [Saprospiraceae bacterium]